MSPYHFDIDSDGAVTAERVEAPDQDAAIRQALLLVSEILRDHALSDHTAISLRICVRGSDGQIVWTGAAVGQQGPTGAEQVTRLDASQGAPGRVMTKPEKTPAKPHKSPRAAPGEVPPRRPDARPGPSDDPAEGKR